MANKSGVLARLLNWVTATPAAPRRAESAPVRRGWAGAQFGRLYSDWMAGSLDPVSELRGSLALLRDRARDLEQNSPMIRRYLHLCEENVVGQGVRLQSTNQLAAGPNIAVNAQIEKAWEDWARPGNCTKDGRDDFARFLRLVVRHKQRDGEAFLVLYPGEGPSGLLVHLVPGESVDEDFEGVAPPTGNVVRQGIEIDDFGKPVAYWFRTLSPARMLVGGIPVGPRIRLEASRVIHWFTRRRAGQLRGETRVAPVMAMVRQRDQFAEASLVAARIGASKMGFIKKNPEGVDLEDDDLEDENAGGRSPSPEVSPGLLEELDPGDEFQSFDPLYPSGEFDPFMNAIDHGVAAGLNVSHAALTGNLREVNYGSLRGGELKEREAWKVEQDDLIAHVLEPIFRAWFPWAALKMSHIRSDPTTYMNHRWFPRRWAWIDPAKDLEAQRTALELRVTSRTRIAADQGVDFEDVLSELRAETELAAIYDVDLTLPTKGATDGQESNAGDASGASENGAGDRGRGEASGGRRGRGPGNRVLAVVRHAGQ